MSDEDIKAAYKLNQSGNYKDALKANNALLEIDPNNFFALYQKAEAHAGLKEYDECISICKQLIARNPNRGGELLDVYGLYGKTLGAKKDIEKALDVFEQGLQKFPNNHILYHYKAVTLAQDNQTEEALEAFQKSAYGYPRYVANDLEIGRMARLEEQRIPMMLAYIHYLVQKPDDINSPDLLRKVTEALSTNPAKEETEEKTPEEIPAAKKENDFTLPEAALVAAITAEQAKAEEGVKDNRSDVQKFMDRFEGVCKSLKAFKEGNSGFYWEYYASFTIGLYEEGHLQAFAYQLFSKSSDRKVSDWLKANKDKKKAFRIWWLANTRPK